ncbi:MAG: hypothetical protein COB81_09005 [Flavobacteriaceae bacterium]|nr:MAG: hypothetical protein COB81_09005 [Flavobacteriaceae bacterium]
MTKLFTLLLLVFSLSSYAQKNAMNEITNLVLNTKIEIDNSLSIELTRFSHKKATSDKQASVASAHLIFFQGEREYELMISIYESADSISYEKEYESIHWNEYTVKLKHISYNESIDVVITKNDTLINKNIPLDKNQLLDQANKIITSKYARFVFDPLLYEITAWKNSEKTIVKYRRIIKFTPLDKKDENLDYDFEVNLTNQHVSPFDFWGLDRFYFPTIEEQEKINFIIKAFGLPRFGFNNSIVEGPDMYSIYIDNEIAFGRYFLDKTTGKECMGSIEGSYATMPDFPEFINADPLIEIKE